MLFTFCAGGSSTIFLKDKGSLSNILLLLKKKKEKSILPLHFLCCTLTNIPGQTEVFADKTTNDQLKNKIILMGKRI